MIPEEKDTIRIEVRGGGGDDLKSLPEVEDVCQEAALGVVQNPGRGWRGGIQVAAIDFQIQRKVWR